MNLTKQILIKPKNPQFQEIDELAFKAKNLFNSTLYAKNKHYEKHETYLNDSETYFRLKVHENYTDLPRKVSGKVLMDVSKIYKSYFKLIKKYKKDPTKFNGCPKPPRYKHKKKGRYMLTYPKDAISRKIFNEQGKIKLSQTNLYFDTNIKNFDDLAVVRIVKQNNNYMVEIVYKVKEPCLLEDKGQYASIDLGIDNLMALTFNDKKQKSFIFNGKPIKSINQYFNKKLAKLKSILAKENSEGLVFERKSSKRIRNLWLKRNNKVKDYFHKVTSLVVEKLKSSGVSKLYVGHNKGWKQKVNIGKVNNQNFVMIPYAKLQSMLEYKCRLAGIEMLKVRESYTSKCSFLDLEPIRKLKSYLGRRIKRGLFKSGEGVIINSDLNGSYNILRNAVPKAFADGIEGLPVSPIKLTASY